MAGEWPQQALEEVAELSGGFAFKSEDYSADGRFVLRTLNIKDDGSIHRDDAVFLPLEKCDLYKRFELQEHDTLFVMVGATLGKVGYVRRETLPALLNQNMWRIRGRDGLCDKRYLQYAFRHTVVKNLGWASGSARDFVRRDDYRTMQIPVPPLAEQKAIAVVLGALDDKIELNRRMNETLEAIVRSLFESWFVDFDFVRAKTDRGAASIGANAASLFPGEMVESELGPIPKGWKVGTLGAIGEQVRVGIDPAELAPEMPYIGLEHMPQHSIALGEWGSASQVTSQKARFRKDDILFGKLRPYFHKVGVAPIDGVCSTDIVVVRPKADFFGFALGHLSSERFVAFANAGSDGTRMPRTSWGRMSDYPIAIPPVAVSGAFESFVRVLVARIHFNLMEARTLVEVRAELLPRLLSGEVRIGALSEGS